MIETLIKPIIAQIILLLCQLILYFGVQKFEGPAHDVSCKLDKKIPYWPYSVFVYILWFPMIALFPLCVYWYSIKLYGVYMLTVIADIIISITVYLVYPSSFQRPEAPDGFIGWVMRTVYRCDYKGKNCMPSMHCSMCFIIVFIAALCGSYAPLMFGGFILLSVLIVISTVLTKQHVIIDVITAFITAAVSLAIGYLII